MQFVSRAEWGAARPSGEYTYVAATKGVKIHYEGSFVPTSFASDHSKCAGHVRALQASHMANTSEGWIDLAYTAVVCGHGFVFEGRGSHQRNGANGGRVLNENHYAVCAMVGDSGQTEPTEPMLHGLRDAIEWLQRDGGAGVEIKGHRDGYATSCPGGPLYRWVVAGAPRPVVTPQPPAPKPQPVPAQSGPAWPGEYLRLKSPMLHNENVRVWQQRMRTRGWSIDVDGWFGQQSDGVCRRFQADKGLGVDGVVGPATWASAFRTDNLTA
jgi:hypothetical protein